MLHIFQIQLYLLLHDYMNIVIFWIFSLFHQFILVTELDACRIGNAWTDMKDFNPFKLKRSAGVGVRIFLPMIGLMGLDWAYGFDEPNYGSTGKRSGSNLHFIIGQEF